MRCPLRGAGASICRDLVRPNRGRVVIPALSAWANVVTGHARDGQVYAPSVVKEVMRHAQGHQVGRRVVCEVLIKVRDVDRPLTMSDAGQSAHRHITHLPRAFALGAPVPALRTCSPRMWHPSEGGSYLRTPRGFVWDANTAAAPVGICEALSSVP